MEIIAGVSKTAPTRTSALATPDEGRRSENCVMGLPRWMFASLDALLQQTRPPPGGSGATLRRFKASRSSRLEPTQPHNVMVRVRSATSLLLFHGRFGQGKTIVSVIPTKPSPAKSSTAKPLAAKSPPTKPLPGERQLPSAHEGTPVPDSKGELPPVIRRTEVVAIALVGLLIICIIAGLYLAKAFFLPMAM